MIKINLLKALKEPVISASEKPQNESAFAGLFARIWPSKDAAEDADVTDDSPADNLGIILIKLVLMFVAIGGLQYHESINIPKLQNELNERQNLLMETTEYNNRAAGAVAEIKKLKEHKVLIQKQISSLDGLSKVRLKYIKALDLMQTNIPEKMWFVGLKSKDSVLEVSGLSFSETEISQFLDVMGRSVYFSDVSMQSSEDVAFKDGDSRKFKKFTLNFVLEGGK